MSDTPYRVERREGDWAGVLARFAELRHAQAFALSKWDDALPYNGVHVIDERTGEDVGYAGSGGDGGSEWYSARPARSASKVSA